MPIPLVNASSELFYLRGLTAGAYLYADQQSQLSAVIAYHAKSYDASESSNAAMKRLDDRDSTAMAGISYNVNITRHNSVTFKALFDILDETDGGYLLDASYRSSLPIVADHIVLSPSVGVTWLNDKLVEHYYGVSAKESANSGLDEYHPDGSFSPYVGLNVNVKLTPTINLFANGKYTFLGSEVKDSPMVDRSGALSGMVGISANF